MKKPIQYERYEEGSWDEWERTVTAHARGMETQDKHAYLPSPAEIEQRKSMLLWLQCQGFKQRFINAVMRFDHPGYDFVCRMVERHGPRETERRLEEFLPQTEYDNE